MRLEQRIMIRTEMSRCAPPMNGGVEHAAQVGPIDRAELYADSDEARLGYAFTLLLAGLPNAAAPQFERHIVELRIFERPQLGVRNHG